MVKAPCSESACTNNAYCKGLCRMHYTRAYRAGTVCEIESKVAVKGAPLQYLTSVVLKHKDKVDCLTWPYGTSGGYGIMRYKGRTRVVSRMVCRRVRGKPPTKQHEARHTCGKGNEACINPHHLRWSTHRRNMADTIKHGTSTQGERSTKARLTDEKVREILRIKGRHTYAELANKFNVSYSTIAYVCQGRTWKHIPRA